MASWQAKNKFRRARGGGGGAVPTHSAPPSFIGFAQVGSTLTSTTGTWSGSPTSYTYQHQISDNGTTGWADISGATASTYTLITGQETKYVRPSVRATNLYGSSSNFAYGSAIGPIVDAAFVQSLTPSADWDGTFDSGYGGTFATIPVDPARTGAKAVLFHAFKDFYTFADDYTVCFEADAYGDIDYVRIYCEGNYVDVQTPVFTTYANARGGTSNLYGYQVKLDHSAIMTMNATGSLHIYAEAVPLNGGVQHRVMGPYKLYARAPGVGANNQYDVSLTVNPQLANSVGVRYQTQQEAMQYCRTNSKIRPLIIFDLDYIDGDDTTRHKWWTTSNLSPTLPVATTLVTLTNADGKFAVLGDYTVSGVINPGLSGIYYLNNPTSGGGIRIETLPANTSFAGIFRGPSTSNNVFTLEGVEITTGSLPAGMGGTGEGATAMLNGNDQPGQMASGSNTNPLQLNFIDVYAHGLSAYGLGFGEVLLNCTLEDCSGSAIQSLGNPSGLNGRGGLAQGNTITRVGGLYPELIVHRPCFTLTYTGPATTVEIEKRGANGLAYTGSTRADSGLYTWEDGVQTNYFQFFLNGNSASNTMVQDVVDEINANWTNWSASAVNPDTILAAAFLSDASQLPSAAISRRTISPGDTFSFTTIQDVHANGFVWDNNGLFQNVVCSFNNCYNMAGAASITLALVKDFSVHHNIFHDNTVRDFSPRTGQPSVISRATSHLLWKYNTLMGQGQSIVLSEESAPISFDAYSTVNDSYFESLGWPTNANTNHVDRIVVNQGSLPGIATNSSDLGGVADTTIFENSLSSPPDATPKAPLLIGAAYVGAKALVADAVNKGWNIAA